MADLLTNLLAGVLASVVFDLNFVEFAILMALLCFWRFFARAPLFDRMERWWSRFASRRTLCIALAFVVPIVLRLCFLPWVHAPQPWIPDEFSHRLIGDTLAHGRLANPTHPLWQHFESIHVFFQPTYVSAYFPGLGAVLALGNVFGHAWIGVLLATGGMCAALLWMLYGFFPPRWALLGGVLAVLRWGVMSYWVNSYWGGELTALGGALVLGGWAWARRGGGWSAGWVLGVGLLILVYTRPMEGAAFAVPIAIALLPSARQRFANLLRVGLPVLCLLAIGLAALGVYNKAVTGDALRIPYKVNQALYGWPLTLPWEKPVQVEYRNSEMRLYYEWERCVQYQKSWPGPALKLSVLHLSPIWRFYFGPALTLPFLWAGRWWRDRRIRVPLICLAVSCLLGLIIVAYPHYISAATGCFLIVIVQALRHARLYRRKTTRSGIARSRIAVATCLAMLPVRAFVDPAIAPWTKPEYLSFSANGSVKGEERARILQTLQQIQGRHVVFVQYHRERYRPGGWVYNDADIDGQRVVWARDQGAESNREVLRYYPDRRPWLVRVDNAPAILLPYDPAMARADPRRSVSREVCPAP
ncbi:MAG: hypothetical protein ABSH47_09910 [Bryobacteraceae bacterium]|jgi:hypothetical protein